MSLERINLNVFSNVASPDAADCLVPEAIRSYFDCFDGPRGARETIIRVFIDPKPHRDNFARWQQAIRDRLPGLRIEIVETIGVVDSFRKSIAMSECAWAMQLEHDFVFRREVIPHGLGEMIGALEAQEIEYLRFNKRRNMQVGYDVFMEEVPGSPVPICRINGRSNNPHLINVEYYRRVVLPHLHSEIGYRLGLEGGLERYIGGGHVYGPLGWPKTVQHLDGRHVRFRDNIARKLHLMKSRRQTG